MSNKLISIIIPCYNVENYINRCFTSLKNQTLGMDNMELIFINDASTDATLERLKEYEKQYPQSVMLINLEKNVGQGAARNIAFEYASAPYVGYVDADDFVDDTMYEKMFSAIEEQNCDFVECDWDFFADEQIGFTKSAFEITCKGYQDFSDYAVKEAYIIEQLFFTSMWNKLFRKDFLEQNHVYCLEGLKYEDMFFCYLAMLHAKSYYHINEYLYHYFQNQNGTVQSRAITHQLDMMEVALQFFNKCKKNGLYVQYKELIDWMFIEKYYIYMIWDIWDIAQEDTYDCYQQLKNVMKQLVPGYKNNIYRGWKCNQLDDFILKLAELDLTKQQFEDLMKKLKQQQKGEVY